MAPKNKRVGRCYELSGRYIADHPDARPTLIHGSIEGAGHPRNPHAWVELDGGKTIHDPVMGTTQPAEVYVAFMRAKVIRRYPWREACAMMVETRTFGAWDAQSERLRLAFLAEVARRGSSPK